jgi:hypothetical protein
VKTVPPPIQDRPNPDADAPFLHQCYTFSASDHSDGTMVWGSQVDMTQMRGFLTEKNATAKVFLTPTAILARAVGLALGKHPEANCRLLGTRIYQFTQQNVVLPVTTKTGPRLTLLRQVDEHSYEHIAAELLQEVTSELTHSTPISIGQRIALRLTPFFRGIGVRMLLWLANHIRLPMRPITEHLAGAPVIINHFGFRGAPPMIAYKPSRFGSRSLLLNVTLGPTSQQPMVIDNKIVIRPVSGLFVRADHRTMDGHQLSDFVASIIKVLENPGRFDEIPTEGAAAHHASTADDQENFDSLRNTSSTVRPRKVPLPSHP